MLAYREISRILSYYLLLFAGALSIPLAVSVYYRFAFSPDKHLQPHSVGAFIFSIGVTLALAALFYFFGKGAHGRYYKRDALALVVMIWFFSAIIGGLPFYFSGTLDSFVDCYFEAMSGLTTTGATVMSPKAFGLDGKEVMIRHSFSDLYDVAYTYFGTIDPVLDPESGQILYQGIEAVGKGLLFWRSFMQWLGGMGIVVLFVAVLPALGVGGRSLYQAEVPGVSKDSLTPRIKETAALLWRLYLGFSATEVALLLWFEPNMGIFDAVCTTFSTISTGGFGIRNQSIASFNSAPVAWIVMIFMLLGSINFTLYFQALRGKLYRFWEPEFLVYIAIVLCSCFLSVWYLKGTAEHSLSGKITGLYSFSDALRDGCFQSISAQTSTGFTTADFDKWPFINQVQMLTVMYIGGMAGSTGGGIKIIRHIMAFRIVQERVESLFRPNAMSKVRVGKKEIATSVGTTVLSFYMIVISMSLLGTFLLAMDGVDPETALTTTACMVNNIGVAFRMGGPMESFAFLSPWAKIGSTIWMVGGRLEFFALLVVLTPRFWRD